MYYSPLTATIETSEFSLNKGKRSIITRSIPYYKDGSVTVQIGTRNTSSETVNFSTANALNNDGFIEHRDQGRFHRFRMNISGNWNIAQGFDVEGQALGRR